MRARLHFLIAMNLHALNLKFLGLTYRTAPHVGVQIMVRHHKISFLDTQLKLLHRKRFQLRFIWTHVISLHLGNSETPETQRNHRPDRYSGRFRRP
ncbi:hypothetical protein ACTXT7_012152 [Hymenolepis weldensis]